MRTGNPKGFELREQEDRTGNPKGFELREQDTLKKSRKVSRRQ